MKVCHSCWHWIWPWQARYTIEGPFLPNLEYAEGQTEMMFHGECACDWLLRHLNNRIHAKLRRVVGWWK